jgi:hypothetical protein
MLPSLATPSEQALRGKPEGQPLFPVRGVLAENSETWDSPRSKNQISGACDNQTGLPKRERIDGFAIRLLTNTGLSDHPSLDRIGAH